MKRANIPTEYNCATCKVIIIERPLYDEKTDHYYIESQCIECRQDSLVTWRKMPAMYYIKEKMNNTAIQK